MIVPAAVGQPDGQVEEGAPINNLTVLESDLTDPSGRVVSA